MQMYGMNLNDCSRNQFQYKNDKEYLTLLYRILLRIILCYI